MQERDSQTRPVEDETWQAFVERCRACTACELHLGRKQVVVSRGIQPAPLFIVGEGPGAEEDRLGQPFVGRSGELLNVLLKAVEIDRFHIGNIVKCRPPGNRVPTPAEAASCQPLFERQLELVGARTILLLGRTAVHYFTGLDRPISELRGQWLEQDGRRIMPTFHPAYILRNGSMRRFLYADVKQVADWLAVADR